jgi:type IV pilus assembly protein PilQ
MHQDQDGPTVGLAHTIRPWRASATAALVAALGAGSIIVAGAAAPIRLVGVSGQDNAVLIESSEPVAYAVSQPDPLTLIVDLRNVTVADARTDVARAGALAGVRLEQASAADGAALARIHVSLVYPSEYRVRSTRNTIRVELTPALSAARGGSRAPEPRGITAPVSDPGEATLIERIQSRLTPSSTIVTLSGNGQLVPSHVEEPDDAPRRLVLDFAGVAARTAPQISVKGALVTKVRVAPDNRLPLGTRVVMELSDEAVYHVERSGPAGSNLDVVFEASSAMGDRVMLAAGAVPGPTLSPDAPITMQQAMLNVAAIVPAPAPAPEPITALDAAPAAAPPMTMPVASRVPRALSTPAASVAARAQAAPATPAAGDPAVGTSRPTTTQTQGEPQKTFTGHPISLDFQGADLRAVLRGFAEISGLNMVIDPDVQGSVDIILNEVPWDQALDVILRGNQLDYTVDGTIVRIARLDTLRNEQDSRTALAKSAADAGTLAVRTVALSYARAAAMAPLIKKAALSARGDVQIDERTNTLIITDLPARLDMAATLLAGLDRAEPQVEVEARIVQTSRDFARAIGVQWGLNGRVSPDIGNTTPLAFPNSGSVGGRLLGQPGDPSSALGQGPGDPRATAAERSNTVVNLGAANATSAIGLALGAVNGAFNLDVALSALEHSGKGRVLSTPRLTTQNNIEAEVAQGIQIPIQTVANNTVTVSFKDAVLVLKVTPQITAANTVIMKITIENATPDFSKSVNGIPPINTQRANTQVQINDGATTVIGGIFISRESTATDRTPLLSRVPLLGWLFKRDVASDESLELLIFITPRILKD